MLKYNPSLKYLNPPLLVFYLEMEQCLSNVRGFLLVVSESGIFKSIKEPVESI